MSMLKNGPAAAGMLVAVCLSFLARAPALACGPAKEDATADRDHDGVPDTWDHCPDRAGPLANLGCPDRDEDNDGIIDRLDYCPSVRGSADNHGCPDASTPGTAAQKLDVGTLSPQSQSPQPPQVRISGTHLAFSEPISFDPGLDTLTPAGQAQVEAAAQLLNARPELRQRNLTIEGHVDEPGNTAAQAKDLSRRRAEAVKKLLSRLGVAPDRLRTQGYGYTRLLDRSETPAAQKINNRIEIVFSE